MHRFFACFLFVPSPVRATVKTPRFNSKLSGDKILLHWNKLRALQFASCMRASSKKIVSLSESPNCIGKGGRKCFKTEHVQNSGPVSIILREILLLTSCALFCLNFFECECFGVVECVCHDARKKSM